MQKLNTFFANFKYDKSTQGPTPVTWYVLEKGSNADEVGRCFTKDELNLFMKFVIKNPINFPGDRNIEICEEEEGPYCGGFGGLIPRQKLTKPSNVILRSNPKTNYRGNIYSCMDVVLFNLKNNPTHNYRLEFDVIARFKN